MNTFDCPYCGESFLTQAYLMEHIKTCTLQYGKQKIEDEVINKPLEVEKEKKVVKNVSHPTRKP